MSALQIDYRAETRVRKTLSVFFDRSFDTHMCLTRHDDIMKRHRREAGFLGNSFFRGIDTGSSVPHSVNE